MYIHAFSAHSSRIKEGAIINIFQRAYKLCDPQYLDNEIKFVFNCFEKLGYDRKFIERAHFKARRFFYKSDVREKKNYDFTLVVPSECEVSQISRLIPSNIHIVYTSSNTTKQFLRNRVTRI